MPRIRTIKPDFFTSEKIASFSSDTVRLLFIGLWTYADDHGRGRDDARLVRAELFALREDIASADVENMLKELHSCGVITRYMVDGKRYLKITNWSEHQAVSKPRPTRIPDEYGAKQESAGNFPTCDGKLPDDFRKLPDDFRKLPDDFRSLQKNSCLEEEEEREEEREMEREEEEEREERKSSSSKEFFLPSDSGERKLLHSDGWHAAYPGISHAEEVAKARAWLLANPTRAPSPDKLDSWFNAWLARRFEAARKKATEAEQAEQKAKASADRDRSAKDKAAAARRAQDHATHSAAEAERARMKQLERDHGELLNDLPVEARRRLIDEETFMKWPSVMRRELTAEKLKQGLVRDVLLEKIAEGKVCHDPSS